MTAVCHEYGLDTLFAMDLTTFDPTDGAVWDVEEEAVQEKALTTAFLWNAELR